MTERRAKDEGGRTKAGLFQRVYEQLQPVIRVLIPLGENETALRELDDYLREPGHWSIEGLSADPRLDAIRNDKGFAALVEKYGRR